jgi:hypothetical protein
LKSIFKACFLLGEALSILRVYHIRVNQLCSDTHNLAFLIDERDEILENLEIAETRYISSFKLSTPEPSIADFQPQPPPADPNRPQISRPRALGVSLYLYTISADHLFCFQNSLVVEGERTIPPMQLPPLHRPLSLHHPNITCFEGCKV